MKIGHHCWHSIAEENTRQQEGFSGSSPIGCDTLRTPAGVMCQKVPDLTTGPRCTDGVIKQGGQ